MEPTTSPHSDNGTPPSASHPTRSLRNHHHNHPTNPPTYRECLRNHAASLGGHALDGCGEFMPDPAASLKCAACGCHRNFHRREDDPYASTSTAATTTHFLEFHRQQPQPLSARRSSPSSSPSPPPLPPIFLGLSTAVPEDQTPATKGENPNARKRVRTKFSQEQKEKMFLFSEKLGWKMMKSDEELVEEFCNEIGVGKGVLKVWMHNNKNTFGRRTESNKTSSSSAATADLNLNPTSNGNSGSLDFDKSDSDNNGIHLHVSADASSLSA